MIYDVDFLWVSLPHHLFRSTVHSSTIPPKPQPMAPSYRDHQIKEETRASESYGSLSSSSRQQSRVPSGIFFNSQVMLIDPLFEYNLLVALFVEPRQKTFFNYCIVVYICSRHLLFGRDIFIRHIWHQLKTIATCYPHALMDYRVRSMLHYFVRFELVPYSCFLDSSLVYSSKARESCRTCCSIRGW